MNLRLENIHKSFGEHQALVDASLEVENCKSLVFIGPSGGGKSTLLRILAGLTRQDRGGVTINGKPLANDEKNLLTHRRRVGVVFQGFNLFPHLSARENIVLPLIKVHGWNRADAIARADQMLNRVQMRDSADKYPATLSGGQRQRVAIARAVSIRPEMLFFDEPTSALDPEMTAEVLELVRDLKEEGRDFVLVTHEMGFARQVADRVAFLARGTIVEEADADTIFKDPESSEIREFIDKVLKY